MIGTKLAHYEITSHLGSGGMGDVYQATDLKLKRNVAIKLLPAEFSSDLERLSRFRREAQLLASLNHPNIAHIYGLEESGGRRCIVMELVDGETLQARLKRGPVPVDEALAIAKQICEALEAAHENGVIHRDLKPGNVMLTRDGKAKILDFGLAKAMESDTPQANLSNSPTLMSGANASPIGRSHQRMSGGSIPGVILGTAAYMSPEQAKGKVVDKRTDIFAFGCVLFEMLTAKPAFNGDDISDILGSVLKLDPAWAALPAGTSGAVRRLLRRCLEKDPRRRLADASDARIEIEEALAAPEDGALPVASGSSRRSWLKFSAAIVLSFAAGLLIRSALAPAFEKPVSRLSFSLPPKSEFTNSGRPVLAFSPDGTKIVYVADRQLYLRSLDKMEPEPIHGTQSSTGVVSPFFSPDGQWIGYHSDGNLRKIPLVGGAPITICPSASSYGAEWTKNSTILFADSNGISRVAADGGEPKLLIATNPGERFFRPQLFEDGDHVLFTITENPSQWDKGDVVVQSLSTGDRKVLVHGGADGRYIPSGYLTYRIGSTVFAMTFDEKRFTADKPVAILDAVRNTNANTGTAQYAFSRTGSLAYIPDAVADIQTRIVDLDGNVESAIDPPKRLVRISPDGKQLVSLDSTGQDAWISDILGKTAPVRLTFDGGYYGFAWSPDGQSIVIGRLGEVHLIRADASGQSETLIKADPKKFGGLSDLSWSPDGKTVFFTAGGALWSYTISTRATQSVFPLTVNNQAGEISPDGRWIAYHSNETPDVDVFVQPYPPTGAKRQVSTGGGHHPLWAPDGKRLYYVKGDQLVAVDVRAAGSSLVLGPPAPLNIQLTQTMNTDRGYDVMPDGKRFVVSLQAAGTNQVNIVLNWFEELRQRTSPH